MYFKKASLITDVQHTTGVNLVVGSIARKVNSTIHWMVIAVFLKLFKHVQELVEYSYFLCESYEFHVSPLSLLFMPSCGSKKITNLTFIKVKNFPVGVTFHLLRAERLRCQCFLCLFAVSTGEIIFRRIARQSASIFCWTLVSSCLQSEHICNFFIKAA